MNTQSKNFVTYEDHGKSNSKSVRNLANENHYLRYKKTTPREKSFLGLSYCLSKNGCDGLGPGVYDNMHKNIKKVLNEDTTGTKGTKIAPFGAN